MGKGVGIDFGLKRTGLSITDVEQIIASSLTTIHTSTLNNFLSNLIENDDISYVVVGYPINLDGKITDVTNHVKGFVKRFKIRYPNIPVYLIDERFTSKIAKQTILLSGVNKKKRRDKNLVDKISATILLHNYLSSKDRKS